MFLTTYVDIQQNIFCKLFLAVPFLLGNEIFWDASAERLFLEKGSLGRDMPSVGTLVGLLLALTWQATSALLELSSSILSSWCGLCQRPDWAPHRLGARALTSWACSWSLQDHEPNSAASSTSGSSKRYFCHWWLACSDTLSHPWWSLEGLHAAAQNWTISYQKILINLAACRHSCLENNWPLACRHSCWASVEG
jgi:hypothetical protein